MAVLRVDHPDIEEFIHAKQNETNLRGFNVSVAVTDRFMECLESGEPFPLTFKGETYKEIDAGPLWEMIMRSTWDWAEPGVLFIDTINMQNNLWYCERIEATNPCGEQPLPPYGACLLGSFNLVKYVKEDARGRWFDHVALTADIPPIIRMMDNVVDRTIYPLHEQEDEAHAKRRMGIGVTGMASALEACGFPYGSPEFLGIEQSVLETLRDTAYAASIDLAKEKGAFPMFKARDYVLGPFIKNLPDYLREEIARIGIRNSHLTSIAPCGTISWAADNVSSGCEPAVAKKARRTVELSAGPRTEEVEDYGSRVFGTNSRYVADVTVKEHMNVLKAAVPLVDSAISKTCNVPSETPWDDFKSIYTQAWEFGAKGCTTYQVGGRREGIMEAIEDGEPGTTCYIDSETGRRECE
jgi:ribonucleoside-diphosphate reductase alpha chain